MLWSLLQVQTPSEYAKHILLFEYKNPLFQGLKSSLNQMLTERLETTRKTDVSVIREKQNHTSVLVSIHHFRPNVMFSYLQNKKNKKELIHWELGAWNSGSLWFPTNTSKQLLLGRSLLSRRLTLSFRPLYLTEDMDETFQSEDFCGFTNFLTEHDYS